MLPTQLKADPYERYALNEVLYLNEPSRLSATLENTSSRTPSPSPNPLCGSVGSATHLDPTVRGLRVSSRQCMPTSPKPAHLGRPGEWQDPRRPLATSYPARHEGFPPTYFCAEHATQVAHAPAFMVSRFHAYSFPCFPVFTVCLSRWGDGFLVACFHVSPLPWFRVFMLPAFSHTPASGVPAIGQPGFPSLRFSFRVPVPGFIYLTLGVPVLP